MRNSQYLFSASQHSRIGRHPKHVFSNCCGSFLVLCCARIIHGEFRSRVSSNGPDFQNKPRRLKVQSSATCGSVSCCSCGLPISLSSHWDSTLSLCLVLSHSRVLFALSFPRSTPARPVPFWPRLDRALNQLLIGRDPCASQAGVDLSGESRAGRVPPVQVWCYIPMRHVWHDMHLYHVAAVPNVSHYVDLLQWHRCSTHIAWLL